MNVNGREAGKEEGEAPKETWRGLLAAARPPACRAADDQAIGHRQMPIGRGQIRCGIIDPLPLRG